MVYLVGAGPGDPGLITVKALELIKKADVILYDRLIDPGLLSLSKPGCTLIDVGKCTGKHIRTQDETTELLVEYGRKKLKIVRLKGGDPFLFGRGGEEAERLKKEGIPFEVVPGVSALSAVPAYAGIPLTHRSLASSVAVATGHGAHDKAEDPVRWRQLAQSVDTIVVFMGIGTLERIVEELEAGGLPDTTPAAVIQEGTTSSQQVVTGTLATIAEEAEKHAISPPALLIVGKTVTLHETLDWFNPRPLTGLKIGVTRPHNRSENFCERLIKLGAEPVLMPTIGIVETIDTPQVIKAIEEVEKYDAILFFSVNGVESFFQALKNGNKDSSSLSDGIIGAIGPATADALVERGLSVDIRAESYIAESFLEAVLDRMRVAAQDFLLVRSDIGRNLLPDGLRYSGGTVHDVAFYSTRTEDLDNSVIERLRNGDIDIVTFRSSSTVKGFFKSMKLEDFPDSVKFASIGPETSRALKKHGKYPEIEADEFTTDGLIKAIIEAQKKE